MFFNAKYRKLLKNSLFLYPRPNIAVFQFFHARFFDGYFFGLQEGSMKSEILLPPMPSFENLVSVLSFVVAITLPPLAFIEVE